MRSTRRNRGTSLFPFCFSSKEIETSCAGPSFTMRDIWCSHTVRRRPPDQHHLRKSSTYTITISWPIKHDIQMQAKMHAYMHFQHMVSTLLPRLWWPQLYCPAYRIAGYQSPRSWAVCSCKAFSLKSPLLKRSRNAEGVERELFARKANPFCILSRHRDGFELLWEIPFNRRLFPSREPIFLTMWAYPLPQRSRQQT